MLAATAEDDKYEIHRSSTPPTLLLGVQNDSGSGAVLSNGVVEYSGVSNAAGCPDQNCVRRNAEWVMKEARYVIETFGARGPGSDGEKSAQMYFASLMNDLVSTSSNPACGGDGGALSKSGAFVEPFAVHPHAFMGFIPVCMVLSWLAMAAHWYSGCIVLEWVCAHLPLLIVVMELVLYTRFLDQLFPMRVSHNVAACLPEPRPNAKKRGHADAAYEWRWNALHRIFMWIIALLGGLNVVFAAICADFQIRTIWLLPVQGFLACFGFLLCFFTNFRRVVPGANDNLTGALTTIAVAKYFQEVGFGGMEDVELVYLVTGSEEAGLRGAKAFLEMHHAALAAKDTIFIALETLREINEMKIVNRDMNGIVSHDPALCNLMKRAGQSLGTELGFTSIYIGASDAAAFTQKGISSCCLAAMNPGPPRYYHTRYDNWDNMDVECIHMALSIVIQAAHIFASEGLGASPSP